MCLSFHFEERKSLLTFFQDYSFLKEVSVTNNSFFFLFILTLITNFILDAIISSTFFIFLMFITSPKNHFFCNFLPKYLIFELHFLIMMNKFNGFQ